MSAFSDVDAAPDPDRLVRSLAESAQGLASMKHYMGVAHQLRQPAAFVLNVGCGAGHDLAVLDRLGVRGTGVDVSGVMLDAARTQTSAPLTRASADRLPFRDGAFSGCWIERVLMHVADPEGVMGEAVRCVKPGGLITIFEPDWSSLTVNGWRVPTAWSTAVRHPAIGAAVGDVLRSRGCFVLDRVEERSWWTYEQLDAFTSRAAIRAAASARGDAAAIEAWRDEVRESAARGAFVAELVKVLWVAATPG